MQMHKQSRTEDTFDPIPVVLRHFVTQQVTDVDLQPNWTVDYATREIARAIDLPERNAENVTQEYELFVKGEDGRAERLRPTALLRDSIRPGDEIEPLPEVVPGRGR